MHEWQQVNEDGTRRMAVPGGWLYQVPSGTKTMGSGDGVVYCYSILPVFVPEPRIHPGLNPPF